MTYTPDPIALANARQSEFYRLADLRGENDRADVTSGSGYSRFDLSASEEEAEDR